MKPLTATAGQDKSHVVSLATEESVADEASTATVLAHHQITEVTNNAFTIQTAQGQQFEVTRGDVARFFNDTQLQNRGNALNEPPTADTYFEHLKGQAEDGQLSDKAVDALAALKAPASGKLETPSSESVIQDLADDYYGVSPTEQPGM